MKKATHSGTCQICGNDQKLPGNLLSNHGYTVRWGFFEGTCPGAHGKPFEESCDLIETAIGNARAQRAGLEAAIEEIKTNWRLTWIMEHCTWNTGLKGNFGREVKQRSSYWVQIPTAELQLTVHTDGTVLSATYQKPAEENRVYDKIELVTHKTEELTLEALVIAHNQRKLNEYTKLVAQLTSYIDWQVERVCTWKPGKLTPVPSNDRPVHLQATRFRREYSALCVSSATAAQKFTAPVTTNESEVTCKRCLKSIEEHKAREAKNPGTVHTS